MVPVEESFTAWRKHSGYEKAYNALEEEFTLAAAMIEARARASLTQQHNFKDQGPIISECSLHRSINS